MEQEVTKTIEDINNRIEELKENIDAKEKLECLSSNIEIMTKSIYENRLIRENILTYVLGAFTAGLIMGMSLCKRTKD
jgi:hypothetical protein